MWKETPTAPYSLKTFFSCWVLLGFPSSGSPGAFSVDEDVAGASFKFVSFCMKTGKIAQRVENKIKEREIDQEAEEGSVQGRRYTSRQTRREDMNAKQEVNWNSGGGASHLHPRDSSNWQQDKISPDFTLSVASCWIFPCLIHKAGKKQIISLDITHDYLFMLKKQCVEFRGIRYQKPNIIYKHVFVHNFLKLLA